MSAVWYWVKIADELATVEAVRWDEAGLTLLDAAPYEPGDRFARWWRVADRNAGPEYGARKVELFMVTRDGVPFVADRRLLDA